VHVSLMFIHEYVVAGAAQRAALSVSVIGEGEEADGVAADRVFHLCLGFWSWMLGLDFGVMGLGI